MKYYISDIFSFKNMSLAIYVAEPMNKECTAVQYMLGVCSS